MLNEESLQPGDTAKYAHHWPEDKVEQLHTSGSQRFGPAPGPCAPPPRSRALRRRQTLAVPSSEPLASRSRVAGEKARSNTRALWPTPAPSVVVQKREKQGIPQNDTQAAACCWLGLYILHKDASRERIHSYTRAGAQEMLCKARLAHRSKKT